MNELTMQEMKERSFALLKQIKNICEQNGIRYTLIYGTLLGAVRHKGFIPWDDDVDVAMPRADYNRFIAYCRENAVPFDLKCGATDETYGYLFAKVCDRETRLEEDYGNRWGTRLGLYVDIFPIDYLGETEAEAHRELNKTRFKRELLVAANWRRFFRSTRPLYIEPIRFAFFLLSRFVIPGRLIRSVTAQYEDKQPTAYGAIICGAYRSREIMPSELYFEFGKCEFEGEEFSCLKNADGYLSRVYGDYMSLPPEEKRVARHNFKAYLRR